MALAILYFVGSLGSALAWDWYSFLAFRFLGGLAVGGASVVSPLYIAEISPARFRGRLVAIQQFNVVLGILVAFLSNYLIARMNLGADGMAVDAGHPGRPLGGVLPPPVPHAREPPMAHRPGPRRRGAGRPRELGVDGAGIDAGGRRHPGARSTSKHHEAGDSLFQAKYRRPILLAVAIAMFNQLSGINALMYYAPKIFKMAGAARTRRCSRRSPWAARTSCSRCWRWRSSTTSAGAS